MPKPTKGRRLGGSASHQKAILANLATSLFEHGRITTTESKAKRLRPHAEKLVTHAKKGDLAHRREVLKTINNKDVVHKLFAEIGPFFADRDGGYTRIIKTVPRKGDNSPMAIIELVNEQTVSNEADRARRVKLRRLLPPQPRLRPRTRPTRTSSRLSKPTRPTPRWPTPTQSSTASRTTTHTRRTPPRPRKQRRTSPFELRARSKRARHSLRGRRARFFGTHQISARHLLRRHELLRMGAPTGYPHRLRSARRSFLHGAAATDRADRGGANRRGSPRNGTGGALRCRRRSGRSRQTGPANGPVSANRCSSAGHQHRFPRFRRQVLGVPQALRVPIRHGALRRRPPRRRRCRVLAEADRSWRGARGIRGIDRSARFRRVLQAT